MDRSWIKLPTQTCQYQQGLAEFLDFAFQHTSSVSKIICPCKNCKFKKWQSRSVVWDHLTCTPFPQGYTFWYRHGEKNDEETSDASSIPLSQQDSLAQVLGKEHPGRVRGMGHGFCPSGVFGQSSFRGTSSSGASSSGTSSTTQLQNQIETLQSELSLERSQRMELQNLLVDMCKQINFSVPSHILNPEPSNRRNAQSSSHSSSHFGTRSSHADSSEEE